VPPTSGAHLPWTVSPGAYSEEIPEELQVHALEHGHVLVQYAPATPAADVAVLERLANRYPHDVIVAPYGKLSTGIALTAWGRIALMPGVQPQPIADFITANAGRYDHQWTDGARDCTT
jgi:hypothetical protein